MNRQLLLLVLVIASLSVAATFEQPVCVSATNCQTGVESDDICAERTTGDYAYTTEVTCEEGGCCTVGSELVDVNNHIQCGLLGGEDYSPEACSDLPPPSTPSNMCGPLEYDDTQETCCDGEIVQGDTCPSVGGGDPEDPPDDGVTCSDEYPEYCDPTLTCDAENFGVNITAGHVIGEKEIAMDWSISQGSDACLGLIETFVYTYNRTAGSSLSHSPDNPQPGITDYLEGVQANSKYSIKLTVTLEHDGVQTTVTDTDSIRIGDEECFRSQREYCLAADTPVSCNSENKNIIDKCTQTGEMCSYYRDDTGRTRVQCQKKPPCEDCNKAFNNYLSQNRNYEVAVVSPTGDSGTLSCDQLSRSHQDVIGNTYSFCAEDQTTGVLPSLVACAEISSCNAYRSQSACESNSCLVEDNGCDWNREYGVCLSKDRDDNTCDVPDPNADVCNAVPGCGFDGEECIHADDFVCDLFKTEPACTGKVNFEGNFEIDPETNRYRETSSNEYNLHKCGWVQDSCAKISGDTTGEFSQLNPIYDNWISGPLARDFTEPETKLEGNLDAPRLPGSSIAFTAMDTQTDVVATYADVRPGTCNPANIQRPTTRIPNNVNKIPLPTLEYLENTDQRDFCVEYYSRDRAHNFEFVQQQDITMTTSRVRWVNFENRTKRIDDTNSQIILDFEVDMTSTCTIEQGETTEFTQKGTKFWWDTEKEPGEYPFKVTCESSLGSLTEEFSVRLYKGSLDITNFDSTVGRETLESPTIASYSFNTAPAATCEPRIDGELQSSDDNPTTDHSFSYEFTTPGEYTIDFLCEAEGISPELVTRKATVHANQLVKDTVTSEPRIPGTNNMRYTYDIILFESATCRVDGTNVATELGTGTTHRFEHELGRGEYEFTYHCQSAVEDLQATWTENVQVDLGTTIVDPRPERNTYRRADIPEISVYGNDRDTCEYNYNGWQEFTKGATEEREVEGETRNYHRFSASNPATSTGFYVIPVRCKAGENAPWEEDNITFAIDEQPPTITVARGEEIITSNAIQVEETISLTVTCRDPEIIGTSEYPGDYSSGLAEMRIDESPVGSSEHELVFELFSDPVTITCLDELGNARSRTLTPQTTDLTGPQRPAFTAVNP